MSHYIPRDTHRPTCRAACHGLQSHLIAPLEPGTEGRRIARGAGWPVGVFLARLVPETSSWHTCFLLRT